MICKKKQRAFLIMFAVLILLALSSCGKTESLDNDDLSATWNETGYTADRSPLEVYSILPSAAIQEDTIYFSACLSPNRGISPLILTDNSANHMTQLTGYQQYIQPPLTPEQEAGIEEIVRYSYIISQISPSGDHLWLMVERVPTNYDAMDSTLLLLQTDAADGTVIQEFVLCENEYDASQISLCCDSQGYAYASFGRGIHVYDKAGTALGQIPAGNGRLVTLADGQSGFLSDIQDGTQWRLRIIDSQSLIFKEEILFNAVEQAAFSQSVTKIFSGTNHYDFLYTNDRSLYGYRIGEDGSVGAGEHILTWTNCDIDGTGIVAVSETEEGFACISSTNAFGSEIVQLRPCDPSAGEPVTITLACQELPIEVNQAVLRFNRQNSDIRVEVKDYGAISAKNGLAVGLDRFTTDLISGNAPDVFYTSNLDEQMLIDRGMLEDLWPWIDRDEKLGGREALVQPLFEAMSQNGKLYTVTDYFFIDTAMGYKDMVGDRQGWSVDELLETYQGKADCHSILSPYWDNRESELERVIAMCAEDFIDRQNWTASFDSYEFTNQLKYLMLIPETSVNSQEECEDWLANREQLMEPIPIVQISNMLTAFSMELQAEPEQGTLVGYPGVAGNGGAFDIMHSMAMWSGSQHKDEVWAFLRSLLLLENQRAMVPNFGASSYTNIWGIPSNKMMCDEIIRGLSVDGIRRSTGKAVEITYWTQADTDRFWNYVEGITVVEHTEENIAAIIRDEAARFFAGDQTAEAAAKAIQSRVNLYLGERKK